MHYYALHQSHFFTFTRAAFTKSLLKPPSPQAVCDISVEMFRFLVVWCNEVNDDVYCMYLSDFKTVICHVSYVAHTSCSILHHAQSRRHCFLGFGIYRLQPHEIAPPGQVQLQITSKLLEYSLHQSATKTARSLHSGYSLKICYRHL